MEKTSFSIKRFLENLFFPEKCASCGDITDRESGFCIECYPHIAFIEGQCCRICSIPLPVYYPSEICSRCRNLSPKFCRNVSLIEHFGEGRKAVLQIKGGKRNGIRAIASLMADKIRAENICPDIVTFVPDTKDAIKEKGRCPTEILSKHISGCLGVPYEDCFEKIRETASQKTLTSSQRKMNVRGAYKIKKVPEKECILIVDDVFTTGATLNECARIMKKKFNGDIYTATISIRDRM